MHGAMPAAHEAPPPRSPKEATVEAWDARADRWDEWTPMVESWFAPATANMERALGLRAGDQVLELAAGTGGFTRALAAAVGPSGHVIATDSGPRMVARMAENLRELRQVTARVMDGERADQSPGSLDAIACRQGFMFFAAPETALARLAPTLRPGGRLVFSVFSPPDRNGVLSRPSRILSRWADPDHPPPPPDAAPGPFSLSDPVRLGNLLRSVGFESVAVEAVGCPLRPPSLTKLMEFYREILGATVQRLSASDQAAAWAEVETAVAPFLAPGSPGAPCEILVAAGRRPDDRGSASRARPGRERSRPA